MPFTYSITNGIGAGFISYVLIKAVRGKAREVHWLLWIVGCSSSPTSCAANWSASFSDPMTAL